MSVVANEVRKDTYLDSVALMRLAAELRTLDGVIDAGVMTGTPSNRQILIEAELLTEAATTCGASDLVIAIRARDHAAGERALAAARSALDRKRTAPRGGAEPDVKPRTLRSGLEILPAANLALISVPGAFASAEALKAIRRGLNVMIFSDNVPLSEERELKLEAQRRGVLVMGPDCGTAIIGGAPIAFANVVPTGDIGIIGASGTGIQEISCLIARFGRGISHAIGTGGRDLSREIGAISTKMAIDLLADDPATRHIVVVSKPPDPDIGRDVVERLAAAGKPATVCFLGSSPITLPSGIAMASSLEAAAMQAIGGVIDNKPAEGARDFSRPKARGSLVKGLFAGGTLCIEAQMAFLDAGLSVSSNVAVRSGRKASGSAEDDHVLIDLGDDSYTRGRPHPMIEPAVRDSEFVAAVEDARIGVILVDMVLGYCAHPNPAGHLADVIEKCRATHDGPMPAIVASITGTDGDPQSRHLQVQSLEKAGVVVASSNRSAAQLAMALVTGR